MFKYLIYFLTLPNIVFAATDYSEIFFGAIGAMLGAGALVIFGKIIELILGRLSKRRLLIIALYIGFFICSKFVLREKYILLVGTIYFCIGGIGMILYNSYRKLYNASINYVFMIYEFMLILFISNRNWMRKILYYDYNDMHVFIFLLFSFPTIVYIAYKFFQKHRNKEN